MQIFIIFCQIRCPNLDEMTAGALSSSIVFLHRHGFFFFFFYVYKKLPLFSSVQPVPNNEENLNLHFIQEKMLPPMFSKYCCTDSTFIHFLKKKLKLLMSTLLYSEKEFPLMFIMFVNMFWSAEYFGYMWVPFEFGSFNNWFWYLAMSNKKLIQVDKSKIRNFLFRAQFLLKKTPTLITLSKYGKYLDDA